MTQIKSQTNLTLSWKTKLIPNLESLQILMKMKNNKYVTADFEPKIILLFHIKLKLNQ